ncbi:MAG: hypothetical protein A2X18_00435 [Bacteroidetes bacterium GWF2_40_14]|nr:MAG: hypothetical protein A2X18_00435 [Bacteroidetes bacterium GWF2_40_14]
MVIGLDKFREAFVGFTDNYIIIGGTACDIVLRDTAMRPRATNDIDMILVIEKMTPEFGKKFWEFIREGGYKNNQRKRGKDKEPVYELFRFIEPKAGYPFQLELLSRYPEVLGVPAGFLLAPIPVGEDLSSLSAIMMDEDLYDYTVRYSEINDGIRVATSYALICLKTKAYNNLFEDKLNGKPINEKDLKKHRSDVLKLIATSPIVEPIIVSKGIFDCTSQFCDRMMDLLGNSSQSLTDALHRNPEEIIVYINTLRDSFTTEK